MIASSTFAKLVDRLVIRGDDPRTPDGWLKIRALAFGIAPGVLLLGLLVALPMQGFGALGFLPVVAGLWHSYLVSRKIQSRIEFLNVVDPVDGEPQSR